MKKYKATFRTKPKQNGYMVTHSKIQTDYVEANTFAEARKIIKDNYECVIISIEESN